jgi:hypothetical protein
VRTHAASTAGLARFPGADPECDAGWLGELTARVAERPLADRRVQLAAAVLASVRGCGASGREQISTTQPWVSRSRSAQTAGAKERAASHPLPTPCGRWRQSSAHSAPACDEANFQKSGIRSKTGVARRAEGPAHPEYDRKCCNRNKADRRGLWWTDRVGVPSFGTVRPLRIDPCDGSSASAGSCLPRALVPLPPLGKNRAGRACGLCNASDCSPRRRVATVARTTVGEFYGELSTPAPKIGVSGPYVRRGFRCNSRCLHRAGAEAETLGVMPSVPKRTLAPAPQEGSTVSEASKPKIPQRTRALAVECRRSPGTGLSAQQGCAFGA